MKNIARIEPEVIGGVDTHQDMHTAAVVTPDGTPLGTGSYPTTRAGYRRLLAWMRSHGKLLRVEVESTGTYGAGLVRLLAREGVPVLEVTAPDMAARRGKGKDDTITPFLLPGLLLQGSGCRWPRTEMVRLKRCVPCGRLARLP